MIEAVRAVRMPLSEWKRTLLELKRELARDNVLIVSAGLAFYGILAVFPALIALVSTYALFLDPASVERELTPIVRVLPPNAARLVSDQLHELVAERSTTPLGLGVVISTLAVLWTASSGVLALFKSINFAYSERETRGGVRLRVLALAATLALLAFGVLSIASLAVLPPLLDAIGAPPFVLSAILGLRWPVLIVLLMIGLAVLYRVAPDRDHRASFEWISPGSLLATVCWLAGSAGLSLYVTHFGRYNETYGALGAAIVLLLWLWLSAYSVLLGAVLNAVLERRLAARRPAGHPAGAGS